MIGVASLMLVASVPVHAEIQLDFLMDQDPKLVLPDPVPTYPPVTIEIWTQALQRPETDLQRMAAETIALGHKHGIPNLKKTIPALETILDSESSHPVARS